MTARVVNALLFYAVWLACVGGGGAQGNLWLGPALAALALCAQIAAGWLPRTILGPALVAWGAGFLTEFGLCSLGVYEIPGSVSCWPPLWLAVLWLNFTLALPLSMSWIRGRILLGAVLGAVGGPASYYAGQKLGAIDLNGAFGLGALAVAWGIFVPALDWLTARMTRTAGAASSELDSSA